MDNFNFNNAMDTIATLQNQIDKLVSEIREEIISDVRKQPFNGQVLARSASGKVICGTVKASDLFAAKTWDPAYFFPDSQADAVEACLKKCGSPKTIVAEVSKLLKEKKVKVGGTVTMLNPTTIKIIQKSSIGQYTLQKSGVNG